MHSEAILQQLDLAAVARSCEQETAKYRRGEPSDERYCLELFKRALAHSAAREAHGSAPRYVDDQAREVLVATYSSYIRLQLNRKAVPAAALDELVQLTWFSFWRAANKGLVFEGLAAALAYMQRVAVSQVISYRRGERQQRELSLQAHMAETGQEPAAGAESELFTAYQRERFRERCAEVLPTALERQVFWLRYRRGLTPQAIAQVLNQRLPGTPYTARKVSDILDRCFRRLSEDPEIRDILQAD
jgi:RNA polymerase sigma factor (sigma-70 family)